VRPGLVKGAPGSGAPIAVKLWSLPFATVGSFLEAIAAPLGIGTVDLFDGRQVKGFICEAEAVADSTDITQLGGWRNYLAQG
jgi:allophanate hydrolase